MYTRTPRNDDGTWRSFYDTPEEGEGDGSDDSGGDAGEALVAIAGAAIVVAAALYAYFTTPND